MKNLIILYIIFIQGALYNVTKYATDALNRGRTSSVHDHFGTWGVHFGTTTSVHIGVQLRYTEVTERTLYVPFRYIHFGTFSNTGVNND